LDVARLLTHQDEKNREQALAKGAGVQEHGSGEMSMTSLKTATLLAFLVSGIPPALAAQLEASDRAAARDAKERAAKKACLNGDPVKGVEILTDLYVDTNDPNYLFNQGRCYEQNGRCEDAIIRFREYLRKAGSEGQAEAQKHISECESLLAQKRLEQVTPPAALATGASPPASAPAATVSSTGVVSETKAGQSGRRLRIAGVATMAVGGAALVTGLVLNLQHNSAVADLKDEYAGDTADSLQTYKVLSVLGYAGGAACLVGGITLYWLGYRGGQTMVAPSVVGGNAGVVVAGGF
jgi:hypothetical protein